MPLPLKEGYKNPTVIFFSGFEISSSNNNDELLFNCLELFEFNKLVNLSSFSLMSVLSPDINYIN